MDEVVTKITNSVKNINTGETAVKISNIPEVKVPTMPKISVKSTDFMTFIKIFLIITILALLGFNVFTYLAKGTDMITYIVQEYGSWIPESIKKTLNLTEKGTKLGLDVTAGTVDSAVNVIEKTAGLKTQTPSAQKGSQNSQNLSRALNVGNNTMSPSSKADSSDSEIQKAKKPGWCYVGSDRKFRSCVKIGVNDQCMSGDIFPTKDICINPSLRE
jgi:hypothetical protein